MYTENQTANQKAHMFTLLLLNFNWSHARQVNLSPESLLASLLVNFTAEYRHALVTLHVYHAALAGSWPHKACIVAS